MEGDIAAMFPNGIRTLLVDDDAKFVKSASDLLNYLNFNVVVCGNVVHALKSLLTSGNLEGFDVILVHAAKAAAAGFDFRAIIEANLLIPVIYFLPQDHEAADDEADKLLRTLQAGTYVIKKLVDTDEVRSLMWKAIAFRKYELEAKARRGGAATEALKGGGHKRKYNGSNPGGSYYFAGTTAAAGGHPAAKGKEKDNVASLQQPAQQKHGQDKKAKKDGTCEAFKLLQSNKAMMNGLQPVFMSAAVEPPFNPSFFSVTDRPSSNVRTFIAGAMYSVAPSALPSAAHISFNNSIAPATAPTMAAIIVATYEPQLSQVVGNQPPSDVHPILMFGSFPYQGPLPSATEGGLFTGDTVGGASATPAAEAAGYDNDVSLSFLQPPNHGAEQDADRELAHPTSMVLLPVSDGIDRETMEWLLSEDFDHFIDRSPPVARNNQVPASMALNVDEVHLAGGGAFGSSTNAATSMAPQDLAMTGTTNVAPFMAMPNGGSNNAASFMVSNVSGLTMAGGDFGNASSSSPSMAPQYLGAVPNGDQLEMDNINNTHGSDMVSQGQEGPTGMSMIDRDDTGLPPMPPSDEYEDNTSFPLGDLHGPMFECENVVDLDILLSGLTSGTTAADADAGTLLVASNEEGGTMDGLGNLDDLPIP